MGIGYCNKCGHHGSTSHDGRHNRPDGEECYYLAGSWPEPVTRESEKPVDQPIAWLIREIKGGRENILSTHTFKSAAKADAAAERMTDRWRTCVSVPVYERI